jgi:hypothetical protein
MLFQRSDLLTSPGFLISLSLLLLNDFLIKAAFNNLFTGKLSDFAGLFAFALFWIAVFPKFGKSACLCVALSFAFWKTSYSQPVINLWNGLGAMRFSRTVDLTDLIALSVIPFAYLYSIRKFTIQRKQPRGVLVSLALISVFAFTATSFRTKYEDYNNKYYFPGTKAELVKKIDDLHLNYFDYPLRTDAKKSEDFELDIPSSICFDYFDADIELTEVGDQTIVSIKRLQHHCPRQYGDRDKLLAEFEKEFIERLRIGTPQTKHYKSKVEVPVSPLLPVQSPTPLQASPEHAREKS